jgi:predicted SAM-dependent methyltransferase
MKKYRAANKAKKLLEHKGKIKLNIGCGTDYKKGWINIDNNSDNNIEAGKLDLNWDLMKPLPFPDNSADFIFSEHFFEHFSVEDGQKIMKDLMRILKPGGVMRIAMPDLEWVVNNYLHTPVVKDPVVKKFGFDFVKTNAEWMNMSFRWWGHKWLYDWEELKRRINEAGYTKVKRAKMGQSSHKELKNLEIRDESFLIAEVTK